MTQSNEFTQQAKENALWAMAWQTMEFQKFYEQYLNQVSPEVSLPVGFVDNVFVVMESDPKTGVMVKNYAKNAQYTGTFAVPVIAGAGIVIAALFLLGTHIKFYRNSDGKWEFLVEHTAAQSEILEKIVEALVRIMNSK